MAGFPPKTQNSSKNIPDTNGATVTKGTGGIPASLKVKNASVKDSSRPTESFTDRVLKENGLEPTQSDKTTGYF